MIYALNSTHCFKKKHPQTYSRSCKKFW